MDIKDVVLRILLVADQSAQGKDDECIKLKDILSTSGCIWKNTIGFGYQGAIAGAGEDYDSLMEKVQVNLSVAKDHVQLLAVPDCLTATVLLCRYKFDLILFDCNHKSDECVKFLSFLSKDYDRNSDDYKLCRGVLNNRGPLNRLWIMLYSKDVEKVFGLLHSNNMSLIHPRWNIEIVPDISVGSNIDFAKRIDLFVRMQVKGCVYKQSDLMDFLFYSGQHFEKMYPKASGVPQCGFSEFQDFMGAEFSTFLRHYGSRNVIRRDAYINGDKNEDQKSVFATWVWMNFYNDQQNEFERKKLFSLYNLMLSFYQVAATMPEDRNGVMRLRETFRRLRYFIDTNIDISIYQPVSHEPNAFEEAMNFFNDAIDLLLCSYSNHIAI